MADPAVTLNLRQYLPKRELLQETPGVKALSPKPKQPETFFSFPLLSLEFLLLHLIWVLALCLSVWTGTTFPDNDAALPGTSLGIGIALAVLSGLGQILVCYRVKQGSSTVRQEDTLDVLYLADWGATTA